MNKKEKKQTRKTNTNHKIPPLSLIPPETQFLHLEHSSLKNMFLLNRFKRLLDLDISDTFVGNLEKCEPHYSINSLKLLNTPLSKVPYYRIMLLILFCPNASIINGEEVTDEEKSNALSIKLMVSDYLLKGFVLISISPVQVANETEAFELSINYLDLNTPIRKPIKIASNTSPQRPSLHFYQSPKLRKLKNSCKPYDSRESNNSLELQASRKYEQWRKDHGLDSKDNQSSSKGQDKIDSQDIQTNNKDQKSNEDNKESIEKSVNNNESDVQPNENQFEITSDQQLEHNDEQPELNIEGRNNLLPEISNQQSYDDLKETANEQKLENVSEQPKEDQPDFLNQQPMETQPDFLYEQSTVNQLDFLNDQPVENQLDFLDRKSVV